MLFNYYLHKKFNYLHIKYRLLSESVKRISTFIFADITKQIIPLPLALLRAKMTDQICIFWETNFGIKKKITIFTLIMLQFFLINTQHILKTLLVIFELTNFSTKSRLFLPATLKIDLGDAVLVAKIQYSGALYIHIYVNIQLAMGTMSF